MWLDASDDSGQIALLQGETNLAPPLPSPTRSRPSQSTPRGPITQLGSFLPAWITSFSLSDKRRETSSKPFVGSFGLIASERINGSQDVVLPLYTAGNLRFQSIFPAGGQKRNEGENTVQERGSKIGSPSPEGSYWIPARIDLDTALGKIDARFVDELVVIKGPYAARYAPDFRHVEIRLLDTPRYERPNTEGSTYVNYQTNGERWSGSESVWGGSTDWGFRADYSHRTGNDYTSGDGTGVPSSYKSRHLNLALGADLTEELSIEFKYLRLDQTDVELPGQAFDIDYLGTDGFELRVESISVETDSSIVLDGWFNETQLQGDASRPGKRRQFEIYNDLDLWGFTDVTSSSTGARLMFQTAQSESDYVRSGIDLRRVTQGLDEMIEADPFNNFPPGTKELPYNSPIPHSNHTNPGVFLESRATATDWVIEFGGRLDTAHASIDEDPSDLGLVTSGRRPYFEVVGTDEFDQNFELLSAFFVTHLDISPGESIGLGVGYAERAPNLTQLYAAEPSMYLIQRGLNTVTGSPLLSKERLWQFDVAYSLERGRLSFAAGGFYSLITDSITFENFGTNPSDVAPEDVVNSVSLGYINTDLATINGAEIAIQYECSTMLVPYASLSYTRGTDRTRNGPSRLDATQVRGFNVVENVPIVDLVNKEPLPGIIPLQSRLGVVLQQPGMQKRWAIDAFVRVVEGQRRVARSLFELPTPGFAEWNLRAYWKPSDRWTLSAGVENIGDRQFQEHLDFKRQLPEFRGVFRPGLNFYFGTEVIY